MTDDFTEPDLPSSGPTPDGEDWRPPGSLEDDRPHPVADRFGFATVAGERETAAQADDLLRRAALGSPPAPLPDPEDDPSLWDDPAARRELRTLRAMGVIAGLSGAVTVPFLAAGGLARWPAAIVLFYLLGAPFIFSLLALLVLGVFATLRRRAFGVLVLGLVLTPLVYGVWAAVLLGRIGRRDASRAGITQGSAGA